MLLLTGFCSGDGPPAAPAINPPLAHTLNSSYSEVPAGDNHYLNSAVNPPAVPAVDHLPTLSANSVTPTVNPTLR